MKISKEAWPFVVPTATVSVLMFFVSTPLMLFGLLLSCALAAFFREPYRPLKAAENQFIAPADGKVINIKEVDEPLFIKGKAKKIDIFMNVFNVHINYAPMAGKIINKTHTPGKFANAITDKASVENEQLTTVIQNEKYTVIVKQIAGLVARRIVCYPEPDMYVKKAEKIGLIKFSSRVEIFLPAETKIMVKPDDKVKAIETILGEI